MHLSWTFDMSMSFAILRLVAIFEGCGYAVRERISTVGKLQKEDKKNRTRFNLQVQAHYSAILFPDLYIFLLFFFYMA